MKLPLFLALTLLAALGASAPAQEKAKSKVLVFPPGAKAPEAAADEPDKAPQRPPSAPSLRSAVAPAVSAGDVAMPAQIAAQFFASVRDGEIDIAYATLTKGSKIAEKPEELRVLKQKTKEAIEVFGVISGHELVENKTVGTRLIRSTYVSLGKEFPLRWRFYFYKADSVWRLIDLRVDDKLPGIFDEPDEPKIVEPK